MSLQEKINSDLKVAMVTKNVPLKDLLRVVIAEFSREPSKVLTDEQVIKVLKKVSENCIECKNPEEAAMLKPYIPEGMTELAMRVIVETIVEANDFTQKDTGKIMVACKARLAGDFDGKMITKIVKEIFS